MARLPRLCIADQLHVLIQRAKGNRPVFADAVDCGAYLGCVRDAAASLGVAVHAYSLTPTEVRLMLTPRTDSALSEMLQSIGRRFVMPYHRRCGGSGPIWEGRFRCGVVDADEYFIDALNFVEGAPVQMGLVERAEDWPWSSAAHHSGVRLDRSLTEHRLFWALGNTPFEREANYRQLLNHRGEQHRVEKVELAALNGWALGSTSFIDALARLAKRRLRPLPRGRRAKARVPPAAVALAPFMPCKPDR